MMLDAELDSGDRSLTRTQRRRYQRKKAIDRLWHQVQQLQQQLPKYIPSKDPPRERSRTPPPRRLVSQPSEEKTTRYPPPGLDLPDEPSKNVNVDNLIQECPKVNYFKYRNCEYAMKRYHFQRPPQVLKGYILDLLIDNGPLSFSQIFEYVKQNRPGDSLKDTFQAITDLDDLIFMHVGVYHFDGYPNLQ